MKTDFDQKLNSALETLEQMKDICSGPLWEKLSKNLGKDFTSEDILAGVESYITLNEQRLIIPQALTPTNFKQLVRKVMEARDVEEIQIQIIQEAIDRIFASNDERVKALFENTSSDQLINIFEEVADDDPGVKSTLEPLISRAGGTQAGLAKKAGISPEHLCNVKKGRKGISIEKAKAVGITNINKM